MKFKKFIRYLLLVTLSVVSVFCAVACNDTNKADEEYSKNNNDTPIAYFSFDKTDANGNFYNEVDGKASKSYGSPSQTDGKNGKSLLLDGESYLAIKEDVPYGNAAHSISAWIKLDYSIVTSSTENVIAGWGKYTHLQDTRLMIYHGEYCVTSFDVFKTYPLAKAQDTTYYHVALTYDGSKYTFYLNGVECATVNAQDGLNIQKSFLYVGGFNDGLKFGGEIDDLYVFGRALDRDDIVKCMNNTYEFEKKEADNKTPVGEETEIFDVKNSVLKGGVNEFVYKTEIASVPFEIIMPDNYNASKKYPLMLFLHGDGTNGGTPTDVRLGGESTLVRRSLVEGKEDFIAIIPCASSPWLVVLNDTNTVYPYKSYSMSDATPSKQLLAVIDLLDECIENMSIDEQRVYLAGYSRGTMASWYMLSETPEKFAAAVVCCGAGDPSISYKFASVPLWVFMGNADPLVDFNGIKTIYDNYESAGGKGHFTVCQNGGHGLESWLYKEENLVDWVFEQVRKSEIIENNASYTVKHILVDEEGNETEESSLTNEGKVGSTVSVLSKEIKGYAFNESKSITSGTVLADGSLCLKLYYDKETKTYNTSGQVKADVYYGGQGESDWIIDKVNGKYTSDTDDYALITFKDWKFNGGVIEWDMMVPSDTYKYNTVTGLLFGSVTESVVGGDALTDSYYVFGRAFTSEYVGFHKLNGAFGWEDVAKLSPPTIECVAGTTYRFRLEWDTKLNVFILSFGGNVVSMTPRNAISGEYFGFYSEVKGTVFSNITVTPREYVDANLTLCNGSNFSAFKDSDGKMSYTSLSNTDGSKIGVALFNDKSFTKGKIEFDMTVYSDDYQYSTLTGLIWGINKDGVDINTDEYHVTGRHNSGVYVSFSKYLSDGSIAFDWENSQEIHNAELMKKGSTVHYELEYDGENLTISVGESTVTLALKHNLTGSYFGFYSEVVGTVYSNIVVTLTE